MSCKKHSSLLVLLLILLFPAAGCQKSRPELRVTFLDVGQGDACVIEGPTGKVVVVDGGGHPGTDERDGGDPGTRVVVPFLRWRGIQTVDLLVPTHADDDHVQGLIAVVDRLVVRGALDCGFPGDSGPNRRLKAALARKRVPVTIARRGQTLDLGGGARIEVLHPDVRPVLGGNSDTNNNAIVLRVVYGRSRILLTADAEDAAEASLLASGRDLAADVLKAGHHGSRWSSTDAFIDRVHPRVAIISCGRDNPYGHPHKEVLGRFARRNIPVYRTDKNGALTVTTDGTRLRIEPTQ